MRAANLGRPRSADELHRCSTAQKRVWAEGGPAFLARLCAYCAEEFTPRSGRAIYCTRQCKDRARYGGGFGLTKAVYDGLLALQFGACALCGVAEKGWRSGSRPLVVDHNHETGEIRGLLCGDCNTALGRFGDDPKRLRAAIRYLKNPPSRRLAP